MKNKNEMKVNGKIKIKYNSIFTTLTESSYQTISNDI